MRTGRRHRWSIVAAVLLMTALVAAACGSNPNESVEADQFIRAAVPSSAQSDAGNDDTDTTPADPTDGANDDAGPNGGADDDGELPPSLPDNQIPADGTTDPTTNGDGGLQLADDIVRRYLNSTYGYSLELVCGPFCNVITSGIDRVGFLSDAGTALINIVSQRADPTDDPDLAALEAVWLAETAGNQSFAIQSRQEITFLADGVSPALLLDWTIDRRATGGNEERWRSLIIQVGPIVYFINAGAIADSFADVEPFLQQSLDSFIGRSAPANVPGAYTTWDFVFPYNASSFNLELRQIVPNAQPDPNFDGGVFVQQSLDGPLEFILTWESIGEALFDADRALTDTLATVVGTQVDETERAEFSLNPDLVGRFALATSTDQQGQTQQVGVFAWYCADTGRSFVLQSFHAEDARLLAQPSLDGFLCSRP